MIFPGVAPRVSPDGSMVLTVNPAGWIGVWDANAFLQLSTVPEDIRIYRDFGSAEFSPYGDRVVTTSRYSVKQGYESSLDVWEAQTGKHVFGVIASRITDAIYTHDGQHIVTSSRDGTLAAYSADDGKLEWSVQLKGNGKAYQLLVSPDGHRALVKWGPDSYTTKADNAGLFDLENGRELMHIDGDVSGLVGFSRDSRTVFGFDPAMKTGTVWIAENGIVSRKLTLQ
jgi:WD40 repeat protein